MIITTKIFLPCKILLIVWGSLTIFCDAIADTPVYHTPPSDEDIPNDKYGDDVRLGKRIFTETYKYARRYAGNGLSCSNCHLDAGRKANAAPLWGAFGSYPAYRSRNDRNNTLEERIQQCFLYSLDGIAPTLDAPVIRALVSYSHYVSKGIPIGEDPPGRGFPQLTKTRDDPNPTRGANVYKDKCSRCHGENGEGVKNNTGYQVPPIWGMDSYNNGAGFARNEYLLAGFIKANMPLDQPWSLTDQEVWDVVAYIRLQIRPLDPRKGIIESFFQ